MRIAFLAFYNHFAYGARSIAAYLERAGHETMLLKVKRFLAHPISRDDPAERQAIENGGHLPVFEVHPFNYLVCPYPTPLSDIERELIFAQIERFQPEVVGFSLTSSHVPLAIEISQELRRRYPEIRQIWGGIYPTMDPETCLEYADAVCVGEGEEPLLEYIENSQRTDIPNLHTRRDGATIRNPMRPLIQDLDSLPDPLYGDYELLIDQDRLWRLSDLSEEEANGQLVISSTRGCPFSCSYCLHGVLRDMYKGQKYLRRKSVDRFLDEIAGRLRDYKLTSLTFWDDIFMMNQEWVEEFAEKYPRRIGLPFGGNCHPRATTRPVLELLRKAGAYFATTGIQSGSPYICGDIYGRNVSAERMIEFGQDLRETGFDELVYDILSRCPFEREEDLRATVHLLARLPKGRITIKHIVLFPFTRIAQMPKPDSELVSPQLYYFYEMLYLLATQPGFDPALLDGLVDDPWLREHPEYLDRWVRQLAGAAQENDALRFERDQLRREKEALEQRAGELREAMPWGIKRAGQHLVGQVRSRLGRTVNGGTRQS